MRLRISEKVVGLKLDKFGGGMTGKSNLVTKEEKKESVLGESPVFLATNCQK